MRLLEWGLILLSIAVILAPKPKRMLSIRLWMTVILAALLGHLLIDRPRWQLSPLYVVLVVATTAPILSLRLSQTSKRISRSIALCLIGIALLLGTLLPVVQLPTLDGTHQVGTLAYELIDEKRADPFVASGDLPRQLRMQVWYPANVTTEPLAPYSDDLHLGGGRWMRRLNLPPFLADHITQVVSRSYVKPPVLIDHAPYPLLLFIGGQGGQRTQNSLLFEQLASEGYIVAAADHPFYSGYTLYPDGTIATYHPAIFDPQHPRGDQALADMTRILSADLALMLDTLADLSAKPLTRFTGRINIDQVGVFGHSTGAAAAATFCQHDLRCKAYLGLDPWLIPATDDLVASGLPQPLMVIRGMDAISDSNKPRLLRLAHNSHDRQYQAILSNVNHLDFTDYRYFSPLLRWSGLVSRDAERNAEFVQTYAQAFFDHELRGWGGAVLFVNSAEFPEATITSHR